LLSQKRSELCVKEIKGKAQKANKATQQKICRMNEENEFILLALNPYK
jgi:hypothetical protein